MRKTGMKQYNEVLNHQSEFGKEDSETVIRFACTGSEPWENKPLIKGDYRCSRVLTHW